MGTGARMATAWRLAGSLLAMVVPLAGCNEPTTPSSIEAKRVLVTNDYVLHMYGTPPGYNTAMATDINDAGVIVGWGQAESPTVEDRAFRYADNQWTVLPLARAYGINNAGWIVGSVGGSPAVLSPTGDLFLLTRSGAAVQGVAFAINSSEMIVGRSKVDGGHWMATRWTLHDGAFIGQSLELVPAVESQAIALNDAGEIVGSRTVPTSRFGATRREAWIWHNGPLGESLGEVEAGDDAVAIAINAGGFLTPAGLIVGLGNLEPGGSPHAFVRPVATAGLVKMDLPGIASALTGVSDGGRLIGWHSPTSIDPGQLPFHDMDDAYGGIPPLNTEPFTRAAGKRIDLPYTIFGPGDGAGLAAVNRCGTIVGYIVTEVWLAAAVWTKPQCDG